MKNAILMSILTFFIILSLNCKTKDNISVVAQKYGLKFVPGGTFKMGSDSSEFANQMPVHQVTLSSFYIDSTEITQREYLRLMGRSINDIVDSLNKERTEKIDINDECGEKYPMFFLTWWDAIKYCNKRSIEAELSPVYNEKTGECDFSKSGFRLPTEAEWEFACKGNTEREFYDSPESIGWYAENSKVNGKYIRHPVSLKKPNAFGLYDMSGNVFEWCNDWESHYDSTPKVNPKGPLQGKERIYRGGDYINGDYTITSAFRGGNEPNDPYSNGFRCVLSGAIVDENPKEEQKNKEMPEAQGANLDKDGSVVINETSGDLDKDDIMERVEIVNGRFRKDTGAVREIRIYKKNNNDWFLWHKSVGAVLSEGESRPGEDPFTGLRVERGCIVIEHDFGANDGSYIHRYRYQQNDWYLIGATNTFATPCDENPGYDELQMYDFNLSTKSLTVSFKYESCEDADEKMPALKSLPNDTSFVFKIGTFQNLKMDDYDFLSHKIDIPGIKSGEFFF